MVSKDHKLSVRRQCALLTLTRSNLYYQPRHRLGREAARIRTQQGLQRRTHLAGRDPLENEPCRAIGASDNGECQGSAASMDFALRT